MHVHVSITFHCYVYTCTDNEHFFLEPDLKLHKIAPEGWKEGWKGGGVPAVTLTLYLRVKFYPDDLTLLRYDAILYYLLKMETTLAIEI